MVYTKVPRILIYKERSSLEDFGVYESKSFNAILYESLMTLDDLKPWIKGAFHEILRLFNDAYYYLTLIFLEKNPLEHYPDYCYDFGVFPQGYDFDWDSESRETVLKSMIYVMLRTFGKNLPAPQLHLLTAMVADINEKTSIRDMGTALKRLRGEEEDIAYKITCNFEFNIMPGSISKEDYSRRDIQELLDSGESLKECLSSGRILREAVNILCESKEQKQALIERLLEPEKEGYGILDKEVTESYRCLYELRSELTGEPLPEKLPFERKAGALGPPMLPRYSQDVSNDYSNNVSGDQQADIDLQTRIEELEEQVDHQEKQLIEANSINTQQATRIKELDEQVIELQQKLEENSGEQRWIDWMDWDVFHPSIKAEEVYKTIDTMATPELGEKAKCYALFRVLKEIKWLKKGAAQKDVLKWWSAHFGCEWHSDNQLKFTTLPDAITKATTTDQWKNCGGNNNEYYYNYAQDLKKAFAWNKGQGQYETKPQFVKAGCLPPEKCK